MLNCIIKSTAQNVCQSQFDIFQHRAFSYYYYLFYYLWVKYACHTVCFTKVGQSPLDKCPRTCAPPPGQAPPGHVPPWLSDQPGQSPTFNNMICALSLLFMNWWLILIATIHFGFPSLGERGPYGGGPSWCQMGRHCLPTGRITKPFRCLLWFCRRV